jgi:hypothetical protein
MPLPSQRVAVVVFALTVTRSVKWGYGSYQNKEALSLFSCRAQMETYIAGD